MNKFIMSVSAVVAVSLLSVPVTWATTDTKTPEKKDELVCAKIDSATKILEDKGFYHLLDMTNNSGVVETIWVSGQDIVISAKDKENSCILAFMKNVTYNPDTLQGLVKAYETQQKKQKDI